MWHWKLAYSIDDGIGFWVTLGYAFEHLIADHENLTKIETVATKRFFLESKTVFMSYPQPLWIIIMQIPWENLCCILLCFLLSCKFHTQNRTEIQTHFSMKSAKQNWFWTLLCAQCSRMSHFDLLFKVTCLVTLFDRKLEVFKSSPKSSIFGIFNELFGRFSNTVLWFISEKLEYRVVNGIWHHTLIWRFFTLIFSYKNADVNTSVQIRQNRKTCNKSSEEIAYFPSSSI